MTTFHATVNVYYSKQVTIEVNADNKDDVIENIELGDYDEKLSEKLANTDFVCDHHDIDYIEEK